MRQAGGDPDRPVLALWREAGKWWAGERYVEYELGLDAKGIRREIRRELPSLVPRSSCGSERPYVEDHTEEHSVRIRKMRDEKVARAMGKIPVQDLSAEQLRLGAYLTTQRRSGLRDDWGMRTKGLSHDSGAGIMAGRGSRSSYAPLHILSGYAFGRGTMLAEEIPILCAQRGISAAAIADPFSLTGCVEFVRMSRKVGVKPVVGARFELEEGGHVVLLAKSKLGYQSLSKLVSECHLGEPRLFPLCSWHRLEKHSRDLLCLTGGDLGVVNRALMRRDRDGASSTLRRLISLYGKSDVVVEIERSFLPWDIAVNGMLLELAEHFGLVAAAGGAVTHSRPEDFPAQDAVVCADTLCLVEEVIGRKPQRHPCQASMQPTPDRALNAEKFLRTPEEMAALYVDRPDLLENSLHVADRCDDDVLPARTRLPSLYDDEQEALRQVVQIGVHQRHVQVAPSLRRRIDREVERIVRLNFAGHFLAVHDMCRWARSEGILFSGRGSVVDSAVAYCLGISRIDAFAHNLHFDRFLPDDGSKRPDIDIDFEANRRDDVRNYLSNRYGAERVATVAAVGAYCTRGIVREVGKALGLSNETIGFLAKRIHGGVTPDHLEAALEHRPELRNSGIPREKFKWVFSLAERLMDVPRNIRAHSSGVVISSDPICETVPVMVSASPDNNGGLWERSGQQPNQLRIIQWDKRSAKHYFDKIDILCLRGQDVLAGAQRRIRFDSTGSPESGRSASQPIEQIPIDDEESYRAMRSGELIGIPQSASPAMRQAHIRLRTANLHDASLVQAGIRPGVGGAVKINELIARRRGDLPYSFSHPELERILGLTYGIIVFQEQVDQLLQSFCGYTSGEAEDIREAIHQRRREGYAESIRDQICERVVSRGHSQALAREVYDYVSGFQGYGFAQGHALAFAEISIRSIYCQQNFPAEYFAALLSAQPAGYYGPCTLVNEARIRGVKVLPPDVLRSDYQFSVEDVVSDEDPRLTFPNGGLRIGLMQVSGVSWETKRRIVEQRDHGQPIGSCMELASRVHPDRDELERLILCGALDGLCPNRRAMLWAVPQAMDYAFSSGASHSAGRRNGKPLPNHPSLDLDHPEPELEMDIVDFSDTERAIHERRILDLDIHRHLMVYERERVASRGGITGAEAKRLPDRHKAIVVGNPIRLRFPPTKSGKRVVFFDLEDETGLLNVTCFDDVYQRYGHAIICSPYVTVIGEAQERDGHTAFLAHRVFRYRPVLASLPEESAQLPIVTADFLVG